MPLNILPLYAISTVIVCYVHPLSGEHESKWVRENSLKLESLIEKNKAATHSLDGSGEM